MDGSGNTVKQGLCAGDILHSNWGYNMTHADFYLVQKSAAVGQFTTLAKLATVETSTGYLCGTAVPEVPHRIVGKALRKKVRSWGRNGEAGVSLTSYSSAGPWSGSPEYFNYCD
jgi:hypothetical protein